MECYLCNSIAFNNIMPYRAASTDSIFQNCFIVQCNVCGLLQINKHFIDAEMENYYKHVYDRETVYHFDIAKFPDDNVWSVYRGRALAKLLAENSINVRDGITVMDLGCGYGHLLYGFQQLIGKNCKYIGVEYDNMTAQVFEKQSWHFEKGGLNEVFQKYKQSVDVLITSHVFEHVIHPHDFLEKCKGMLSEKGVLLWEIPNLNMYNLACEERHSPQICLWDIDSLRTILEQHNFEIIFFKTAGKKYNFTDKQKPVNTLFKKIMSRMRYKNEDEHTLQVDKN